MEQNSRTQFRQWLESGEARLQPLSLPQRELWEASPVAVGTAGNHICGFIEIKGPITPEQCEQALHRVIERQEALRTSFLPGKEKPLQMIRATGSALLTHRDLSAAEAQPEAMEELMLETYRAPFDLLQGPLHRVQMLRRGVNDHVLAFSIHHAIADGWSLGVFVQDLCTAWVMGLTGLRKAVAVGLMGLKNTLPPVAQTYRQPAEVANRADFWKAELAGSRPIFSESGAATPGFLHRWVAIIPPQLTNAVRELATRQSTTLFSTLLAAFQWTISKWSGQNDILVGTPVANRTKEAMRETMGYFAGVVPLRGQVDAQQSFDQHLQTVSARALDCFAQALPFAELAALQAETHRPGAHTIFDVRFALQNHPVPDVNLPRISTKLRMRSTGTARFDLGCEITQIGSELEVVWLYRPHMVSLSDLQALHQLFIQVLTNVCLRPEAPSTI